MKAIIIIICAIGIIYFILFRHNLTISPFSYKPEFDWTGLGVLLVTIGIFIISITSYNSGIKKANKDWKDAINELIK